MKSSYENENHSLRKENSYLKSRLEKFKLENDDLRDSFIAMKDEKFQEMKNLKMIIEDIFQNTTNLHIPNIYQSHKQLNNHTNERPNTQRLVIRSDYEDSIEKIKNLNEKNVQEV